MTEILKIILYILSSILLITLIILSVKLIIAMNKIENTVDNINIKISKLNNFFSIIDYTTDKLALVSDKVVDGISYMADKIFKKNKKRKEEENE